MFDWISHSSPTEGGVVQWTEQSTQKSYAMVAAAPLGATRLLRTFSPSNRAASLIDVWTLQGVGANPVKLMIAYEAGAGQQYMKVAVTIVNTAATPLLDMYYERLLKPSSTTKTWVRYQPFTSDGLGTLVHPTLPHASAVVSLTSTWLHRARWPVVDLTVTICLARTMNATATGENSVVMVGYSNQTRVNWATSQNVNPYQTFGTGPNTLQDCKCSNLWRSYFRSLIADTSSLKFRSRQNHGWLRSAELVGQLLRLPDHAQTELGSRRGAHV